MLDPRNPPVNALPEGSRDDTEDFIDPVWTVYFDGRPLDISRPICGYTLDQWRHGGKDFFRRVLTPDSLERLRSVTREIRTHGRAVHNIEVGIVTHDRQRTCYYLVNYRPVMDGDRVIGLQGDARNITDLREARAQVGGDSHFLAALVSHTRDLLWVFYFDGRPGYVNRGYAGYAMRVWRDEGLSFFRARLVADSQRRLDRSLDYLKSSGESVRNLELDLRAKTANTTLRLLAVFSPISDSAGVIQGVYAILHDITELTLVRAALGKSELQFQSLIENAHDLVWITDRSGRWTYLNKAAVKIYGREPDELIGHTFLELTHPDHVESDWHIFQEVLRGKSLSGHETVHLGGDGVARHLSFNVQPRLDKDWEIVGAMGIARDVTEERLYQRQLEHLADHDQLTGLYNRHHFEQELQRMLDQVERTQHTGGLLYIDIDNFKYVNDVLGHTAGDELLLQVSQLLLNRLRGGDVLARFGGDEFTVLLSQLPASLLPSVAESYQHTFQGFTFMKDDRAFDVRISIGATLIDAGTKSMGTALAQADLACALAKQRGRNQVHVYNVADQSLAAIATDIGWSRKINEAIERDRFVLHYQPIVHIASGRIDHYEALVRMQDGDDTLIPPAAFLPAAERFGLIHAIDRHVTHLAIRTLATADREVQLTINLSGRVFDDKRFLPALHEQLDQYAVEPSRITFEITETAAISNMATAREFIESLRAMKCSVSLDDFGSGFSSYTYLKHLTVDYLKIDGHFVQNLAREPVDQAIVQSMNQVAKALGRQTVAEFVEDAETLELLRQYGVDFAQGYYLGMPQPGLGSEPRSRNE